MVRGAGRPFSEPGGAPCNQCTSACPTTTASGSRLQREGFASSSRLQREGFASSSGLQREGFASSSRLQREGFASGSRLQREGFASGSRLQREGFASGGLRRRVTIASGGHRIAGVRCDLRPGAAPRATHPIAFPPRRHPSHAWARRWAGRRCARPGPPASRDSVAELAYGKFPHPSERDYVLTYAKLTLSPVGGWPQMKIDYPEMPITPDFIVLSRVCRAGAWGKGGTAERRGTAGVW